MWVTWLQENAVFSLLIGLSLGGFIGGLSLFLANSLYAHFTRPVLGWGIARVRAAALPLIHLESRSVGFYSSMIAIHNRGKSSAQNCTGHLEIAGNREHVCWFLPYARRAITVNCGDFEFLEVCGIQNEYSPVIGPPPEPRTRIAPTEEGWQPAGENRDLGANGAIRAKIVVTAANAKAIEMSITILPIAGLANPATTPLFRRDP